MSKSLYPLFLLIAISLSFTSCRKEIDENTITTIPINIPDDNITSSIYGKVLDENGEIVEGAIISLDQTITESDNLGFFHFEKLPMNGYGQIVTIRKDGYFNGIKMVEPNINKRSYVECQLVPKNNKQSFASDLGADISTNGGSSVSFSPNSIVDENGNIYSGNVDVYSYWMDPTLNETFTQMPGDLRAVNQTSEIVQLATFGMMAVELEGSNGQELNLAENTTATLKFTVPEDLLSKAPATIALWSFNEELGYWIEEGEATLIGNQYVGEVSHFSFWNCDAPFPLIQLDGHLEDTRGLPLNDYKIQIEVVNSGIAGCDWTDSNGDFGGKVPADQELILNIYNHCGDLVYSQAIGPFAVDTYLPPIVIPTSSSGINVSGYLVDCNGVGITNGYLVAEIDNHNPQLLFVDNTGFFSKVINPCSATTMTYHGIDLDSFIQSNKETIAISSADINLDTIELCTANDYFFYYTIGGSATFLDTAYAQGSANVGELFLSGWDSQITGFPTINVQTTGTGTYNPTYIILWDENNPSEDASCSDCLNLNITFTEIGYNSGDNIEATFDGTVVKNGTDVPVSGAFKSKFN